MIRYTYLAVCCLLWISVAGAAEIPEDKKIIIFESEFGLVNFYHELHATLRTNACSTCHHTLQEAEPIKPCHDCHLHESAGTKPMQSDTPKIAKAFHVRCKGCHQYTVQILNKTAGPVTCALCHLGVEHWDDPSLHPR